MPKSEHQKLKLLYLADILRRESDEAHPLRVQDMIDRLAALDVQAERKSIYSDLAALEQYGMDITQVKSKSTGYFLAQREFELPELKLLVDAVQSSRFLSAKKSRALIRKLESLASRHEAHDLQRQVYAAPRVKSLNEAVYYSIDTLHAAINADKQITFTYFEWTVHKTQQPRRSGALYRVSPYALVWDSENYYLVAYDEQAAHLKHYRVDKMLQLAVTELPRAGRAQLEGFDMAAYTRRMFGMFGGQAEPVEIEFASRLVGVVLDRFGMDVTLLPTDDAHFKVCVPAVVSPQFMGWVAGFGTQARIVAPAHVAAAFAKQCKETLALYE